MGLTSLQVVMSDADPMEEFGRKLRLAQMSMKVALEVLSMRAQYITDIKEQGVVLARQMAFLVEQGHDAVFSESYHSVIEALTVKMEFEAAKGLSNAHLEKTRGRIQGGAPYGSAGSQ